MSEILPDLKIEVIWIILQISEKTPTLGECGKSNHKREVITTAIC